MMPMEPSTRDKFLDDDGVFGVAHASAAVFFGENHAEEAHFGQLGDQFGWKFRGFVPFHHVGQDFAFGEFAHGAPQLFLFVGQCKFHGSSPITKSYLAVRVLFIPYARGEDYLRQRICHDGIALSFLGDLGMAAGGDYQVLLSILPQLIGHGSGAAAGG